MEIYLIRHGPAEQRNPAVWPDDDLRPLSQDGRQKTRLAAAGMVHWFDGPPNRLWVSPLTRALQTAAILQEALDSQRRASPRPAKSAAPGLAIHESLRPDASPSAVLAELAAETAAPNPPKSMAFVGHEPHLGQLLTGLLTGWPSPQAQALTPWLFHKAAVAHIRLTARTATLGALTASSPMPAVQSLGQNLDGVLVAFVPPKILRRLGSRDANF